MKNIKTVTVYPLVIIPRDFKIDADKFFECTKKDGNAKKNLINKGDKIFAIVSDFINNFDNYLIHGRFLRLNKEILAKINLDNLKESDLNLDQNEYLEEESYFLFDTKNMIILGEYNPRAVNILSPNRVLEIILNALNNCQLGKISYFQPIPVTDFLDKIKDKAHIKKVKMDLSSLNADYLESLGFDSRSVIYKLSDGEEISVNITIKYDINIIASSKYIEKIKIIKNRISNNAESFKIYTDEFGDYDLIKNNFISLEIQFIEDGTHDLIIRKIHDAIYKKYKDFTPNLNQILRNFIKPITEY